MVEPESVTQLSALMARCHTDRLAMMPVGSGSKLAWGAPVRTDLPLVLISMARLNQLIDHAGGDLTVTAQAGMKFADLQAVVDIAIENKLEEAMRTGTPVPLASSDFEHAIKKHKATTRLTNDGFMEVSFQPSGVLVLKSKD